MYYLKITITQIQHKQLLYVSQVKPLLPNARIFHCFTFRKYLESYKNYAHHRLKGLLIYVKYKYMVTN